MSKSLFGYAKTTKAIAKEGGWKIFDDKFTQKSQDEYGNLLLPSTDFDPQISELEIPSPGFPPNNALIKKARNLISEYDYFESLAQKIWISGTNGKTTTTKMTQFLLEGFGSDMGGNVGTPLGDMDKNAKFWVLETSSFTIHYTQKAYPWIYVLLPITPDHLSWHGSFEEYTKAKLKPLTMMKENGIAFVPKNCENHEFTKSSKAKIYFYQDENDLAKFLGVNLDEIAFKTPFLMDALLALCIAKISVNQTNIALLNKFVIENNKLEEFKDYKNRLWVNDTKATNIDACLQAVKRYKDKKILLIAGGDDKGVDLSELFRDFQNYNLEIYAIGSNTDKIIALSQKFGIKCKRCEFLSVAVNEIAKVLNSDEVALLSPACASLDQFKSYAERGDKFKEYVAGLKC